MKNFSSIISFLFVLTFTACSSGDYLPLKVVDNVDVQKYMGKWYEIASFPNSFQEGCHCTTAEYSIIDSATIRVINKCNKDSADGEVDEAAGKAFVVPNTNNAKLEVQFFWPFRGDYWIIELDKENYSYAVVGNPSRKYLWILAREPEMDKDTYDMLITKCKEKGFDTTKLRLTDQSCN